MATPAKTHDAIDASTGFWVDYSFVFVVVHSSSFKPQTILYRYEQHYYCTYNIIITVTVRLTLAVSIPIHCYYVQQDRPLQQTLIPQEADE